MGEGWDGSAGQRLALLPKVQRIPKQDRELVLLGSIVLGTLGPGQAVRVMRQVCLGPRRVFQTQRMVYQLYNVAVGIPDVGLVVAGIVPGAPGGFRPYSRPASGSPGIGDPNAVQVGKHFIPILDLRREMHGGNLDRVGGVIGVYLGVAQP